MFKKYLSKKKMILKFLDDLLWPLMTFKALKRLHNVSIQRIFYQNRFINEWARKNFSLILVITYLRNYGKTEFFVRCKRTYVLKKTQNPRKGFSEKRYGFFDQLYILLYLKSKTISKKYYKTRLQISFLTTNIYSKVLKIY